MVAGAAFADFRIGGGETGGDHRAPTALVIGLGGGALPMALRRMYPSLKVVTVEIDPDMPGIAKEHFGLKESDDCKVRRGFEERRDALVRCVRALLVCTFEPRCALALRKEGGEQCVCLC